jgi:hypothetical protein
VTGDSPTVTPASDGPDWSSITDLSPYLLTIFIKSDGTPGGFPSNAILYANAAPPTGWAIADGTASTSNAVNKMLRGPVAGADGGGTGGTGDVHAHTQIHTHATSHAHAATVASFDSGNPDMGGSGFSTSKDPHDHTMTPATDSTAVSSATDTSTNGSLVPAWLKVLPVQNKTGGVSHRKGLIAMWLNPLSQIPGTYQLCDGTLGTPNMVSGNYVMGAASTGEIGNTGGSTTHGHTGAGHLHTSQPHNHAEATTSFAGLAGTGPSFGLSQDSDHSHTSGGNSSAVALPNTGSTTPTVTAATNSPTHITVAFIQLMVEDVGPAIIVSD